MTQSLRESMGLCNSRTRISATYWVQSDCPSYLYFSCVYKFKNTKIYHLLSRSIFKNS
uniref:p6 protein n=1 Tax=Sweet potato chlorotic stunt virus TaxID=81931 RepID=A0A410YDG3_9CLOS|nr:p6 protein [Sweet potato chlorotic stunt virus]